MHLFLSILACSGAPTEPSTPAAPSPAEPVPSEAVPIELSSGPGAVTPFLASVDGALWLLWQEPQGEAWRVQLSQLVGLRASAPRTVVQSEQLLVNWADFPSLVGDGAGGLVAHWLEKKPGGPYAYDVVLAQARDGQDFQRLGSPHQDGTATEHGFVSLVQTPEGPRAFWLDGRATATGGPTALRTALVSGAGIGPEEVVDERVCDCCATAAASVGADALLLYRDRSPDEVRDVVTARWPSREGGALGAETWTVSGCPVNGPAVDAAGDRVAAAWFTAAGGSPRVRAALSSDGGRTWSPPMEVDAPRLTGEPLGRVDIALAHDETAVVTWLRGRGEAADVMVRRIAEQRLGEARVLGSVAASRAAGVPQIERDQQDFVAAWTVPGEGGGLRAVRLPEAAIAAATALPTPATAQAAAPAELPDFVARDLEGREVSLRGLRGQVVLVNLWATWCGPCREELPELAALATQHGQAGLAVVAVSVDAPEAEGLVRSTATALAPGVTVLYGGGEQLASQLGAQALPRTFLYGRDGSLRASFEGRLEVGGDALLEPLRKALAETP